MEEYPSVLGQCGNNTSEYRIPAQYSYSNVSLKTPLHFKIPVIKKNTEP